ncbi:MAG: hypothetical protein NC178_04850, partial [Bacteroides sp.]|nr:hypothetical protein [Bacteroides sp.]
EHFLGKEEVAGSNPAIGSKYQNDDSPDSAHIYRGVVNRKRIIFTTNKPAKKLWLKRNSKERNRM